MERGEHISVVLLTYNHAHAVGDAIRTALDQTVTGLELLVSDDGSTDGTWEVIQEIASGDPRVRAVRTPENLGMARNANFAVGQTSRPYVALLHHDDLHRPDLLARWADVMDRYPDVAFVFNRYDEAGEISAETYPERMDGPTFLHGRLLRSWGCPVRGTAMIRRTRWEELEGMRPQFGLLADVDLWMRLAARWAVGFVDAPLIKVRHARPADYPEDYVGLSWRRNRLLYEVHAANVDAGLRSAPGRAVRRARLRLAVSLDAAKWLAYVAVRRPAFLARAEDGATPLELAPVRIGRRVAARWARRRRARAAP